MKPLDNNGSRCTSERGAGLVEALIATAIVGVGLTALLAALATGSLAVNRSGDGVTAENLARSQMEYAKSQVYRPAPAEYKLISPVPDGYVISALASPISGRDQDIQRITVTVTRDGQTVAEIESFKANRWRESLAVTREE